LTGGFLSTCSGEGKGRRGGAGKTEEKGGRSGRKRKADSRSLYAEKGSRGKGEELTCQFRKGKKKREKKKGEAPTIGRKVNPTYHQREKLQSRWELPITSNNGKRKRTEGRRIACVEETESLSEGVNNIWRDDSVGG